MDPRQQNTATEEDYHDYRNKSFFFKKNYEEFAGGWTDEWMNVDENIIIS
jgi:hypothetical protein